MQIDRTSDFFRNFHLVSALSLCLLSPAQAEIAKGQIIIRMDTVADGLTAPVTVAHANDSSGRLFIVEQSGQIRIVANGVLLETPFLDIASLLPQLSTSFDERGLLGLAFHPNYAENGRFFVRYSAPRKGNPQEPCFGTSRGCHEEILAEYKVSAQDPNVADSVGKILFRIDEPQFNHNAGTVAFGPDGYLYFSLGDGGGANDGLADNPPSHGEHGNGQNINTVLGALLRIDVDRAPQTPLAYAIPADNPFAATEGADEIYAYGFRNPYRFSFDDAGNGSGALYVADVGQNVFEELNIVEKGGNYGWVIKEGFVCFDPFNPGTPLPNCSSTGALGEPLLDPITAYDHDEGGLSIIGGFVYRGDQAPALEGKYVFGDFSDSFGTPGGRLYYLEDDQNSLPTIKRLQIGTGDTAYGYYLKGFGRDQEGEIYACGSSALAPTGTGGIVQKLVVERTTLTGDLNHDLCVDRSDYGLLINALRDPAPIGIENDLNGDGKVNRADARTLINAFTNPRGAACR
ncbi:MAG: PQQ-dependent sugar dehydrogenase [Gammaproteobacteria bacterium]